MTKLYAGVIGLGVGERHLESYAKIDGVEVKAICDIDRHRLSTVGDKHGIEHRSTDYRSIMEDPNIDAVSICSYDDVHAEQVIAALRHDKHVMVEKPIALHRHEAEAVLRAQQVSGKIITSNLILRASPRFQKLKRLIDAGEFGEVFCIEGDYIHKILQKIASGWRGKMDFYCVVYGGGIHLIDLMRWLLGQEVEEVCGMGNKLLTRDTAYKYDDTIISLLRFEGGTLGKCLTTFGPQRPQIHTLNIYGTKKTFVNDVPDAKLFDGDGPDSESVLSNDDDTWRYPGMEKGDLIPDFIAAIREGREPSVGTRDVFRVMDVCFAAREAAETGRTVKVSYLF